VPDLLPDLPGTPFQQAEILAAWASEQPDLIVSDAGLDLWDALYNATGMWGTSAYQCREWASEWTVTSETGFGLFCATWSREVLGRLENLQAAIAAQLPAAAEVVESTGEGAGAQAARVVENWRQFADAMRGQGRRTLGVGVLVIAGLAWLAVRRG